MKPHRGTSILVLGILGLVICGLLGVAAWIMGNGDLKAMDAGQMDPTGRGQTNGGRICGIIATILFIVQLVGLVALFAIFGLSLLGGVAAQ